MPNVLVLSGPALPLMKMADEMKPDGFELNPAAPRKPNPEEVDRLAGGGRLSCLRSATVLLRTYSAPEKTSNSSNSVPLATTASIYGSQVNSASRSSNNGGANAIPVAEFAMTLILACHRHLPIAHNGHS